MNPPLETGQCSLRKCIQGDLEAKMARVEVKSFAVKADALEHMEIAWSPGGDATFHDICWKAVLDSLRMDNPFRFSTLERSVAEEAKRTAEYFDSMEKLDVEADRIVEMLKSAKYAIAFTGAGISTSAGVGDFRGKSGKWTQMERSGKCGASGSSARERNVPYSMLRPTYTHEALQKLVSLGMLKHIISQNTDGLHRLSGIPRDRLSELHGNAFHERCEKCGTKYEHPFVACTRNDTVPDQVCVHCHCSHRTGRICERKDCGGYMSNTIINFGDSLEKRTLSTAEEHAKQADLVLCLGTTLRVSPACDLVEMGKQPVRLVICNRQPTPFDHVCYSVGSDGAAVGSRVFRDCDELMQKVMCRLLSSDRLHEWENGRTTRLTEYAKQRQC